MKIRDVIEWTSALKVMIRNGEPEKVIEHIDQLAAFAQQQPDSAAA